MIQTMLVATTAVTDSLREIAKVASPGVRENFMSSLEILAKGMLGIFLFMLLFYLLIYVLERIFKVKTVQ